MLINIYIKYHYYITTYPTYEIVIYFIIIFTSPITLLVRILFQTLIICSLGWLITNTRWFAFILFIIYLGGLIVLFIYIVSLASNEKFFSRIEINHLFLFSLLVASLILIYRKNTPDLIFLKTNFTSGVFLIFSKNNIKLTLYRILYLLFSLIVIIKICNKYQGPLKSLI